MSSTSLLDQANNAKPTYKDSSGNPVVVGTSFPVLAMAEFTSADVLEIKSVAPAPSSTAVTGSVPSSAAAAAPSSAAAPGSGTPLRDAAITAINEAIKETTTALNAADDSAALTAITDVNTKVTAATTAATAANDTNTDPPQKTNIENAITNILDPILKELMSKTTKSDIDIELNILKPALEALSQLLNNATTILGGKKSSKTQRRRMRKYRGSAKRRNRSGKRV